MLEALLVSTLKVHDSESELRILTLGSGWEADVAIAIACNRLPTHSWCSPPPSSSMPTINESPKVDRYYEECTRPIWGRNGVPNPLGPGVVHQACAERLAPPRDENLRQGTSE